MPRSWLFRFRVRPWLVVLVVLLLALRAAALDPARQVKDYRIAEWGVGDGLPYPAVPAVAQTPDGYLWVGTRTGLARFDGVAFTHFTPSNLPQLPDERVITLTVASDGALWVGTARGLSILRAGIWEHPLLGERIDNSGVMAICEATDGSMLIAHSIDRASYTTTTATTGLFRVKDGRATEVLLSGGASLPRLDRLERRKSGEIIGVGRGLFRIEADRAFDVAVSAGLDKQQFIALAVGPDDSVWLGGSLGLAHWNAEGVTLYSTADGLPSNSVRSLQFDSDGTLWVGTSSGLARWRHGRFEPLLMHGIESLSNVLSLHEDMERNLWVGSDNGLFRVQDVKVTNLAQRDGLPVNAVLCVLESRDGSKWVGTLGGGLARVTPQGIEHFHKEDGLAEDSVGALAEGADGTLWIGYYTRGIGRFANGKFTYFTAGEPVRFRGLAFDQEGVLWAASSDGLFRLVDDRFERESIPEALQYLRALHFDPAGNLWLAAGRTFGVRRAGAWTVYPKPAGTDAQPIQAICSDAAGSVWLLQDGPLLIRVRDDQQDTFSFPELGPLIYSAVSTPGELWVNFRSGIARFALDSFDLSSAQPPYTLFTDADGMRSRAPNNAGSPGAAVMRNGALWFSTSMGAAIINPWQIRVNDRPPTVVIEKVLVDKVEYTREGLKAVPPGRGELALSFTALSLANSEQNRFRYRLHEFDPDWVEATPTRVAHYGGLAPGTYRFQVTACNNEGVWSPIGDAVTIVLRPHFYQTWWFAGAMGLVLSGGVAGLVRWRDLRLKRRALLLQRQNEELEQRIAERTAELRRSYDALRASQRELVEISRLAGIAEMATGVLHNLGNALNSVKVGAALAHTRVSKSDLTRLRRLADLLVNEQDRLAAFFAQDERAAKVPRFLMLLSEQLETERAELLQEMKQLLDGIEHVAQIIAAQQAGARATGVVETVSPVELIETSYRMNQALIERHAVYVRREFQRAPDIHVDRQKALQILANLIRNAVEALATTDRADKRLTLVLRPHTDERIQIAIRDNGVGIAPSHAARIFQFGFTTKPNGHGFGLHNSANAARELGGELRLHSDGEGQGATFTLELPVKPAAN